MNKSANLTFYGINLTALGITTAKPQRNGVACGNVICKNFNNVSDTYYFNVTHFTNYSIGNNTVPNKVALVSPTNGSDTLLNRTPLFNWSAISADLDGDPITYQLLVQQMNTAWGDCGSLGDVIHNVSGISNTNFTNTSKELCLDAWYNWSVRAYDGEGYGEWSNVWNFSVMSTSIILVNGSIDFGSLAINTEANTTENNPGPLIVENKGNVNVNISIYAQDTLWERSYAGFNSSYFQFKAGNSTSESNSFDWLNSIIDWTYMQNYSNRITTFAVLNYSDSNDLAELEVYIKVPSDELADSKSSIIVFEAIS